MTDVTDVYEQTIEALRKELRSVQEMLFLVLDEVGEPVVIPAEDLKSRITKDKVIAINFDEDTELWTFEVEVINGQ